MQKIKDYVMTIWMSLSESARDHIISAARVFGSVFFTCLFIAWKSGITWSWSFIGALIGMAISSGLKAAIQTWMPASLGGKHV